MKVTQLRQTLEADLAGLPVVITYRVTKHNRGTSVTVTSAVAAGVSLDLHCLVNGEALGSHLADLVFGNITKT